MTSGAAVAETHISTVLFAGDRAFKLLKPVAMDFLDFSTSEKRLRAANRELALNRRIAPDVYLGLANVVEGNRTVDRFIVMRRMPADRRLSALLASASGEGVLRQVARAISQFHSALPPVLDAPMASAEAILGNWDDNVQAMIPFVGSILDAEKFGRVCSLYRQYVGGRPALFDERVSKGMIRDGHGDLTAEDIFCLDDGPRILDCLAFSDDLRICDVLNDIAFLAMDVERLSGPPAAEELMRFYLEFSNEHHGASLLHHYIAYRAHVRAKVACLRFQQGATESGGEAQRYLDLSLEHLETGRVRLVLVGGAPGTGKTTVANALGARLGWIVLNSDELRKDLAGVPHRQTVEEPFGTGLYSDDSTERTYRALVERAARLLEQGESVVLDASWPSEQLRQLATVAAADYGADLHQFELHAPLVVCKERISARAEDPQREDASDATPAIAESARAAREVWPEADIVNTLASIDEVLRLMLVPVDGSRSPS